MQPSVELKAVHRLRAWLCVTLAIIVCLPSGFWWITRADATASPRLIPAALTPENLPVSAAGRIEPKDGVLQVAAPDTLLSAAIVTALHVRPGDWVQRGQPLAELNGREELEALLAERQRKVAVAHARLLALQAGAKKDDIRALRAEVESEEANLSQIQSDTRRSQQLLDEHVLSAAAMQAQQARLIIASRSVEARRARLQGLSSVRPADVAVAEAELRAAEAEVDEVKARLERTTVRAPCAARVLTIYAYPGQRVGAQGVLALGQTAEMFVDAEIAEEDLPRVRMGQKARIDGDVLRGATLGTVEEIGYLIGSREVFKADPTAFSDSRVVHVKIRAADPTRLERFINARVTVEIQP
jgi:HlyD family secretion protein